MEERVAGGGLETEDREELLAATGVALGERLEDVKSCHRGERGHDEAAYAVAAGSSRSRRRQNGGHGLRGPGAASRVDARRLTTRLPRRILDLNPGSAVTEASVEHPEARADASRQSRWSVDVPGPARSTVQREQGRPRPADPTPGRRTGVPRSTCVRYLDTGDGLVVWGTGSGSPRDPDWFRNLRAAQVAEVQLRARRLRARPHELIGAERDAMWNDVVLVAAPEVAKFARRAGRTIPVARLEPIGTGPA
ncbi:nitroreductase family deazaflavin-dependent oxidoreductase [Pengzhenrongella frigida]|uniref:Nitroreductase family deazaflavin-dependent oxidoreductase n=1 Tax=Pengzhenrongella frigida TaxID=1259133 RepID=A0A4Q5MWI9_9MICO|nr:nitroreductase family deazaflavin-dependent oxidoreductase [Cellulomonas sp. HLT2-17]